MRPKNKELYRLAEEFGFNSINTLYYYDRVYKTNKNWNKLREKIKERVKIKEMIQEFLVDKEPKDIKKYFKVKHPLGTAYRFTERCFLIRDGGQQNRTVLNKAKEILIDNGLWEENNDKA